MTSIINLISGELDLTEFDERDSAKLRRNDAEGELYLRLFIRSRQGDLEKAYKTMVSCVIRIWDIPLDRNMLKGFYRWL